VPSQTDIAIVGAGPHALTLTLRLLREPGVDRNQLVALDPSGDWLQQWRQRFAALGIPQLRSPSVHHPHPEARALRAFARARNRTSELHAPYQRPSTALFNDFCRHAISRWQLAQQLRAGWVSDIVPVEGGFRLPLADGAAIAARRVVLAVGGGRLAWPEWVRRIQTAYPPERLRHAYQLDLRQLPLAGERVAIVGGGQTAGRLALGAIARGAQVTLLVRRALRVRQFDTDPGWLGPKRLRAFWAQPDWQARRAVIAQARGGGSVPPGVMAQLERAQQHRQLAIAAPCEVSEARWQGQRWQLHCSDGRQRIADRIWLATGESFDAAQLPLLQGVRAAHPAPLVGGLPVLDEQLRWPGGQLHVMGGLAALQLGPVARNLSGARMASERIAAALVPQRRSPVATGTAR